MAVCALIDAQGKVIDRTIVPGPMCPPDPTGKGWRWIPIVEEAQPTYDPLTQTLSQPQEEVLSDHVRKFWNVVALPSSVIAENTRLNDINNSPDTVDLANRLKTATGPQIDNWIETNVTSLASARAVLKAMVKLMAYKLREPV